MGCTWGLGLEVRIPVPQTGGMGSIPIGPTTWGVRLQERMADFQSAEHGFESRTPCHRKEESEHR